MIKHYIQLTKPGIIGGNLIAAVAGFLLAAKGQIDWPLFCAAMLSVILIIGSGCTFNNCIDKDIDGKMERTQSRVLVTGELPIKNAILFACVLALLGFTIMYVYTNVYALSFGVLGFFGYVVLYTLMSKRTSIHSTAIGSISGACPPVIGYVAVTTQLDYGALIIFLAFCLWQIPHSYAIAIFRFRDYQHASIPLLPLERGIKTARIHIIAYVVSFTAVALLLTVLNYTGLVYATTMIALGAYWAYIAVVEYSEEELQAWGKKMFILSIIIICCFSLLISTDYIA